MKKRFFSILLSLCMVLMLLPVTAFAEDDPTITISGADVVCAPQDYEFTVTVSEGVTLDSKFGFDTGSSGSDSDLTVDDDGVVRGVMPAEWYHVENGSFQLTVHGKTKDNHDISASKTVTLKPGHSFVDGVCQWCGAKQQYTVEYDGGAEFGLQVAFKTHGVDLPLAEKTFHREGYVQTGWMGSDGIFYELGGVYTTDADVTMYAAWEKIVTLTVPFTTTVELGGNTAPGETTFDLAIVGAYAGEDSYADVTVSGSVTTDGAGDYTGTLTLTGPDDQLWNMLCEGAFVQQVNAGEEGWTYDDTVWGLLLDGGVALSTDDAAPEYTVVILPATCDETDNGVYYDLDWEADPLDEMSFTNIYTKSTTKPTESTKPTTNNTNTGVTTSVQTGDNSNLMLWLVLFAVSAIGAIGTGVYNKRRRNSRTK